MPFTFSHPAAIVPIARRGLPLSALVAGSLAPDFPYFFPFLPGSHLSHTLLGVFVYCIPTGLVALWLFEAFLKQPAFSLLPASHQVRLAEATQGFAFFPLPRFAMLLASLALGALTHIAWDAFTHSYGWAVERIPLLSLPVLTTRLGTLHLYRLLQHSSTLLGAGLLVYWYVEWYRRAPVTNSLPTPRFSTRAKRIIIAAITVTGLLPGLVLGCLSAVSLMHLDALREFGRLAVVSGISALFFGLVLFSGWWHLWKIKAERRAE